jgi:hypothetical protein
MSNSNVNTVKLPRVSKGKRPVFFDDPSMDQMVTLVLELLTEVMVLRDRQDSLERLLAKRGQLSLEEIRSFIPAPEEELERKAERDALVKRVLRLHMPHSAAEE